MTILAMCSSIFESFTTRYGSIKYIIEPLMQEYPNKEITITLIEFVQQQYCTILVKFFPFFLYTKNMIILCKMCGWYREFLQTLHNIFNIVGIQQNLVAKYLKYFKTRHRLLFHGCADINIIRNVLYIVWYTSCTIWVIFYFCILLHHMSRANVSKKCYDDHNVCTVGCIL